MNNYYENNSNLLYYDDSASNFYSYDMENHFTDDDSETDCGSDSDEESIYISIGEPSYLFSFYEELLEDLKQKYLVSSSDIKSSIHLLISCYRRVNDGRLPFDIDFNSMECCLGYMHRYAPAHMALVSKTVSTMLKSSSVLLPMMNKRKLVVTFLGGGPGNDFVGFFTALHGHHNLQELDVCVVDKIAGGWENVFMETVEKLQRCSFYQDGHKLPDVSVTPSFISADLRELGSYYGTIHRRLMESNLVFLVKTLSHIPHAEKLVVLKGVVINMRPGALLIYIDSPFPHTVFESLLCLKPVYQSSKKQYKFNLKSNKFGYPSISKCRAEVRVFERI